MYTKCKLSAFGMEKEKAMRSWIKAVRVMIQALTAKAYSQILHTSKRGNDQPGYLQKKNKRLANH